MEDVWEYEFAGEIKWSVLTNLGEMSLKWCTGGVTHLLGCRLIYLLEDDKEQKCQHGHFEFFPHLLLFNTCFFL